MNKVKTLISCVCITIFCLTFMQGQISLSEKASSKGAFSIVVDKMTTPIYYDEKDEDLIATASELLAQDIERVTGRLPLIKTSKPNSDKAIIVGSIKNSRLIDQLVKSGKLNVSDLQNSWERFIVKVVSNPFPGVDKALVIVGSDRRGTAYGVFELSKIIGVSPWYWWADVPVTKHKRLAINVTDYISKEPSIKYRGVFLNDEDWGLKPWASKMMDPKINDIGPNTYSKISELLLRLKLNMLAPAMHEVTGAFYKYPENKIIADKYGILITTSHAEPLLYNNTTEWHHDINGDWNYTTNKDGVLEVMDKRVAEASLYENIYTVGMRGIHDRGMSEVPKGYTKANVLEQVIENEREILNKHIDKSITEIPQIFVPYKEVLDIYRSGMRLPEDITLVWPDDNYGYIKKLSDTEEALRSGGAGVYYHISYLGSPNDYLWLNTTPPALMYEELSKAYKSGAQRYWLLNVGDIKPGEVGIQFFADFAWDVESYSFEKIPFVNAEFLASIFGEKYKSEFKQIYNTYFHLGFERKPEYMGWDWRWNSIETNEKIIDTEFSFKNYNEAENRIKAYTSIANQTEAIYKKIDKKQKSAFYQLVYYPVIGAYLENLKMLTAQKNRWYAKQGRAATNRLIEEVKEYDLKLSEITETYNNLEKGKWQGIMTAPERVPEVQLPPLSTIQIPENAELGLFIPNADEASGLHILSQFDVNTKKDYTFEIYNKGKKPLKWKAVVSNEYLKLSQDSGETTDQDHIKVSIDWKNLPKKKQLQENITINSGDTTKTIFVSIKNSKVAKADALLYVADNEVVSIDPARFSRINEKNGSKVSIIEELGYAGNSIQFGNIIDKGWANTSIEYDFYTDKSGYATVYTYALPLFGRDDNTGTSYGVQIDDSKVNWESTASAEYSFDWQQNVIRNAIINTSKIWIREPGNHTLRLIGGDPGMIIQKAVIDFGGLRESYMGPEPSLIAED